MVTMQTVNVRWCLDKLDEMPWILREKESREKKTNDVFNLLTSLVDTTGHDFNKYDQI